MRAETDRPNNVYIRRCPDGSFTASFLARPGPADVHGVTMYDAIGRLLYGAGEELGLLFVGPDAPLTRFASSTTSLPEHEHDVNG